MAKLVTILLPMALLQATPGYGFLPFPKLYSSPEFDIIGTDVAHDVFRVYREKFSKTSALPIIDMNTVVEDPSVDDKKVIVNATEGTLAGTFKLVDDKLAKMSFDVVNNIIYGTFPVTVDGMKIKYNSFAVKIHNLQDKGTVSISPKKSSFELSFAIRHNNDKTGECTVRLENVEVVELADYRTVATGFGDPDIDRDIDSIVKTLMPIEILHGYMTVVLQHYLAGVAPKVFRYCKYVHDPLIRG